MTVTLTHTQVKSVSPDAQFVVTDTVTAGVNAPVEVFVYLTETGVFHHVATAADLQAYGTSRATAQTDGDTYYRLATMTATYAHLADAVELSALLISRLRGLCVEQDALLTGFAGTTTATVTS